MPSAIEYLNSIIAQDAKLVEQNNALLDQIITADAPAPYTTDTAGTAYSPFKAGIRQGANAFAGDIEYFKALGNTLIGDDRAAERNLENARIRSDQASKAVAGLETFEEFTDAPTFSGFLNQVQMGLGQVTPFAAETIAAGLTGFITGGAAPLAYGAARKAATEGAEAITKKLVTDIVQKKGRGETLDALENDIIEGLWSQTKRGAKIGGQTGVVAGTYPINTGESFKEFDEAGVDLNADRALQSLLLGGASTALEVTGEALVLSNLAKLAKRKAGSDPKSILNLYATNIAKNAGLSSITEGATELGQEGLLVAQRMAVDDSYTQDDANLRLGQAWFMGTIAGTAMGGGGAAVATTPDAISRVFDKAKELSRQGRAQEVNSAVDQEQYGNVGGFYTTQESQGDIDAQYDAMQDEGYGKRAVWVAGDPKDNNLGNVGDNSSGTSTRNGKKFYYANIKGRGTIFSQDIEVVNSVVNDNGSDASVGAALGYSATKSPTENATTVVQVLDAKGEVISEELTTQEGLPAARAAAQNIAGSKGKIAELPLAQAQEQRAQRVAAERVRNMTIDSDEAVDPNEQSQPEATAQDMGLTEAEPVQIELTEDGREQQTYQPKQSADQIFPETESLRREYEKTFNQTVNWSTSPLGLASDSTLRKVNKLQSVNPESQVELILGDDNRFRIEMTSLGGDLYTIGDKGGNQRRLPLGQFIQESIARASRRSKFSKDAGVSVVAVDEDGTVTEEFTVNIADMIAAGKRINETELGGSFDGIDSDVSGLSTIMGELNVQGYELQVAGRPLRGDVKAPRTGLAFEDGRSGIPENYNLVTVNAKGDTLYDLLIRNPNTATKPLSKKNAKRLKDVAEANDRLIKRALAEFDAREPDATSTRRDAYAARLEKAKQDNIRSEEIMLGAQDDSFSGFTSEGAKDRRREKAVFGFTQDEDTKPEDIIPTTGLSDAFTGFTEKQDGVFDGGPEAVNLDSANTRLLNEEPPPKTGYSEKRSKSGNPEFVLDAKQTTAVLDDPERTFAEYPLGGIPEAVSVTINQALKKLRLKGKVVVMPLSRLKALGDGIFDLTSDRDVGVALQEIANSIGEKTGGVHYRLRSNDGNGVHVVILNDEVLGGNELELTLTAGHEIGHALFIEEMQTALQDPELRGRLYRDFEKARAKSPELYDDAPGRDGFEEWVADQTAKWTTKNIKAQGVVHRFFARVAERLKSLWNSLSTNSRKRFGQEYSQAVDDFISESIIRKQDPSVKQRRAIDPSATPALMRAKIFGFTDITSEMRMSSLYDQAVAFVAKSQNATISSVQRELRIGYNKTVELFDQMEAAGVISPMDSNGNREVLIAADADLKSAPKQKTKAKPSSMKSEMKLAAINDAVNRAAKLPAKSDQNTTAAVQKNTQSILSKVWEIFAPMQSVVRRLGAKTGAGVKIANMIYGRSGEKGLGFIQKSTLKINEIEGQLVKTFGDLTSQEFKDSAQEARSSKPTSELSAQAQQIRGFLKRFYDEYVSQEENTSVGFREDFYTVLLDFDAISADLDGFSETIATERGDITASQVKEIIVATINNARTASENVTEALIDGLDPLHTAEESIELTKGVRRELLDKYSKPAEVALISYVRRLVKRVEWNRATKSGENTLTAELAKLSEKDQATAKKALGAALGFYPPLSEDMQNLSSAAQTLQIFTTLSLATISSIPELAAAVINTREFSGVFEGFKTIAATILDPKERWEFARDIGVIGNDSLANAFMSESDMQYLTPTARAAANKFFEYTGLNLFTKFTRVFAAQMAQNFIVKHATTPNSRSGRYLNELGLEADVVKQWVSEGKGFSTPSGLAVKQGLQKFVESTMLRPNAAERPMWASDPRYALLWQLKSFPYSYGQVVIGGVVREMKARQQEGRAAGKTGGQIIAQDLAPHMALFGLAVLPFAMLSLELKEKTKYAMKAILPFREADASIFKTDNMEWGEYFAAAYGSAGVFGPLALLTSAQTDVKWGKPPVSVFGPTVDTLYQVLIQGNYERVLPIYNQF